MKHLMVSMLAVCSAWMAATSAYARPPIKVPDDWGNIPVALEHAFAESSDVVLVTSDEDTLKYSFTMKSNIPVQADEGVSPVIDPGPDSTYAVDWPSDAGSNTVLRGFTILGASTAILRVRGAGVVDSCIVQADSLDAPIGILFQGTGEVRDCVVNVHSGGSTDVGIQASSTGMVTGGSITVYRGTGFDAPSGSPSLADCTIEVTSGHGGNTGVAFGISSTAPSVSNCLVHCTNGTGMDLSKGTADQCTVVNTSTAVGFRDADSDRCIAVGDDYGFYLHSGGHGTVTNCIAPGDDGYYPSYIQGTTDKNEDPLFCAPDDSVYTLRVDSWGNAENNENDLIGAFEVACMYGTLVRSATYTSGGTLGMTATTTVSSSDTLTLGPGTSVQVTKTSPAAHLTVGGTLTVDGDNGDPVVFGSADGSPTAGDWYGIEVLQDAESTIEYAEVRDGVYGAVFSSVDLGTVIHSLFENNQVTDIVAGGVASPDSVGIGYNTIRMAGSIGIQLTASGGGIHVFDNDVTGNYDAETGIDVFMSAGSATIEHNTVDSCLTGAAIKINSGSPIILKNTLDHCKYGVNAISANTAQIGTSSSSSDNIITNCSTNGIRCTGSSVVPTVRNNQIYSNWNGVYAGSGGFPDLGNAGANGNNSIYGNSSYCVTNKNMTALLALGNWWGSCAAPTCTSGSVSTGGWLCSQPASMPAPDVVAVSPATGLRVLGVRPNPTVAEASIAFALDEGFAEMDVRVFDLSGRLVRTLAADRGWPRTG